MDTIDTKTTPKRRPKDWLPSRVKFELDKRGFSLRQLSLANGLAQGSLRKVLRQKWPRCEQIIANAIGKPPEEIWPSRYNVSQAIRISPRR